MGYGGIFNAWPELLLAGYGMSQMSRLPGPSRLLSQPVEFLGQHGLKWEMQTRMMRSHQVWCRHQTLTLALSIALSILLLSLLILLMTVTATVGSACCHSFNRTL